MSELRMALISDVHANRWALEAVLEDIEKQGCDQILNAGDCIYGPLDPVGTADILMNLSIPPARGVYDRALVEAEPEPGDEILVLVRDLVTADQLAWFGWLKETVRRTDTLICHGTPVSDTDTLIQAPANGGGYRIRSDSDVRDDLREVTAQLVVCGRSHAPGTVRLSDGRLCINPGSVGLQVGTSEFTGASHEIGSPHARYASATHDGTRWSVRHHAVTYDWEAAAKNAERLGHPSWSRWLATGRL